MGEPSDGYRVLAIALKTARGGPMREVAEADGLVDAGLKCPVWPRKNRGITFLAAGQWKQVCRELAADLPWTLRRANVLLDADGLGDLIGRTVQVGDLRVRITGETAPCDLMDRQHAGLQAALRSDFRGGIHGRILTAGRVRVGDRLTICAP
jgi:MOSC domain-containing protein YiiM